ncbi:glycosyltransferase [Nitrolancea hollandica]|uniref:Glycosyltransferase family 28 N-terminal domain-containing protein n=1 Tax=Nitrolancea hollandica Lb TaxID=1129897 RepID=I4EMA8_9BACT|nr:hypothetical protein NITHO_5810002 [Nitrolancea hollandica Lb]
MRITITTLGTRDDVQPNVALGLGLQAAGYTICVATHARFETLTTGAGLNFAPVAGDPRIVALNSESGKDASQGRTSTRYGSPMN